MFNRSLSQTTGSSSNEEFRKTIDASAEAVVPGMRGVQLPHKQVNIHVEEIRIRGQDFPEIEFDEQTTGHLCHVRCCMHSVL